VLRKPDRYGLDLETLDPGRCQHDLQQIRRRQIELQGYGVRFASFDSALAAMPFAAKGTPFLGLKEADACF
jgi:hypothetical protein